MVPKFALGWQNVSCKLPALMDGSNMFVFGFISLDSIETVNIRKK